MCWPHTLQMRWEAANQRLFAMTGGRYQLECHQMTAAETQAALDLDVLDNYTGKLRSVGSLSGGETFQAALALALGLSDVIQNYAGGVELDVLFVDEGFGTLDAESLEQAVATLHSLVQGRPMVGIISHVPELKSRIENQLVVTKTPGRQHRGPAQAVSRVGKAKQKNTPKRPVGGVLWFGGKAAYSRVCRGTPLT